MTTWKESDHQIKLDISIEKHKALIELSGNTFSIELSRPNRKTAIKGMLIIYQLDKQAKYQAVVSTNLWIDSKRAIIPLDEKVRITLINECDPMYQLANEKSALRKILPVEFSGIIQQREKAKTEALIKNKAKLRGEINAL
ncbi:MAG: hypothetical protein V5789_07390 [Colwellia sp.]